MTRCRSCSHRVLLLRGRSPIHITLVRQFFQKAAPVFRCSNHIAVLVSPNVLSEAGYKDCPSVGVNYFVSKSQLATPVFFHPGAYFYSLSEAQAAHQTDFYLSNG